MAPWKMLEFTGKAPLADELAIYLGDRIAEGIYRPGDKLPTERELAAELGLSRKTVRLALGELERQGFIFRRVGKGTFVKRAENFTNGRGRSGPSIALVSFKYTNPYSDRLISHLFEGMNRALEKADCNIAVQTLGAAGMAGRDAACRELVERLRTERPEGIIFATEPTVEAMRGLSEVSPVLQAGYFIEGEGAGYVGADMMDGMRKAIGYLMALGHTKIAMISHHGGEEDRRKFPTVSARVDVYAEVMAEMGLRSETFVIPHTEMATALSQEFTHTAVITTATYVARELLEAARERGVRVPEEMSLVGYDDAGVGEGTTPRFTSMKHLSEQMGRVAAEKLLGLIDGSETAPVRITMPAELILRESCARPRGDA